MAEYYSDRQLVERAIIPRMFRRLLKSMVDKGATGQEPLEIALSAAALEPILDLEQQRRTQLAGRIDRLLASVLDGYENRSCAIVLLALVNWVNSETEKGRVLINPESDLWTAIEAMVACINDHPDLIEAMERSGRRNGEWIGERFRELGYFR